MIKNIRWRHLFLPVILIILLTMTAACIKKEEAVLIDPVELSVESGSNEESGIRIEGTTVYFNAGQIDLADSDKSINSVLMAEMIDDTHLVAEGHINPKVNGYVICDINNPSDIRLMYGTCLTWFEDDLSTVIYQRDGVIYGLMGDILFDLKLSDPEYVWEIKYGEDKRNITVLVKSQEDSESEGNETQIRLSEDAPALVELPSAPSGEQDLIVFYGDSQTGNLLSKTVRIPDLSAQTVMDELKKVGTITQNVTVLSMDQSDESGTTELRLDLSGEFKSAVQSNKSEEEYLMIYSVVNTFLMAYGADSIMITVDGSVLDTGHKIYEEPFYFAEDNGDV